MIAGGVQVQSDGRAPHDEAKTATRIARHLRDWLAAREEDVGEADAAVATMSRWAAGEPVPGAVFSDLVYSAAERGVLRRLSDAEGTASEPGWSALTTAVMYVAWLAYRLAGEPMPEDVAGVDESTLDLLQTQCEALQPPT